MGVRVSVSIRSRSGYKPQSLFKLVDNGIRRRLPAGMAEMYRGEVIRNIEENRFGFELSKSWVERKKKGGYDERPYVMTGFYKNNIEKFVSEGHFVVGFRKKVFHPRARMPLHRLALILEYGSVRMGLPARPLWRKSLQRFRSRLKREKVFKKYVIL